MALVNPSLYPTTASLPTASTVMTGHVALVTDDGTGAGHFYKNTGSVWADLALRITLAAGSVAVTSLAASGSEGQALINHSGVWTPSTDFSAQNLKTTGTLTVGGALAPTFFRADPIVTAFADVYMGAAAVAAPSQTNYSFSGDGATATVVNVPNATGLVNFSAANALIATFTKSTAHIDATLPGLVFWGDQAYGITAARPLSDIAPFDLTLRSQAPWASATTVAKRTPSNIVYDIATPVTGGGVDGLDGFHKFQIATNPLWSLGFQDRPRTIAAIYPGAVTAGATNYAVAYSIGDAGSGGVSNGNDYIVLNSPGSVMTRTNVSGVGTTGSQVRVAVNNRGVTRFMIDGMFFGTTAALPTNGYVVSIIDPIADVAPVNLTIRSHAPLSTAINFQTPGNLVYDIAAPVGGGLTGFHNFQVSGATRFQVGLFSGISSPPVGAANVAAIWMNDSATPTTTNYVLSSQKANGVVSLNSHIAGATGQTGGRFNFGMQGLGIATLFGDGLYFFDGDVASSVGTTFKIDHRAKTTDIVAQDFTIRSPGPWTGASVHQNPGNLVFDIAAPVGAGTRGNHIFKVSGNRVGQIGTLSDAISPLTQALWIGDATPDDTNWVMAASHGVKGLAINAPGSGSGTNAISFFLGTTGLATLMGLVGAPTLPALYLYGGVPTSNNFTVIGTGGGGGDRAALNGTLGVVLYAGGAGQATFDPGLIRYAENTAWIIRPSQRLGNNAAFDIEYRGQQASATGTGANLNSGNVVVSTVAAPGGTAGSVFLKPNATTALEAAASGIITLPHYSTAGILHNDASGVVSSSLIVAADITNATITPIKWDISGLVDGQTWVRTSGVLVATTVGTGSGTLTGITAGAGLTGGGTSGTVTVDVVAGDITLVVSANSMVVGTIGNANLAAGGIAYSKLNLTGLVVNADIVSLAWSKITGHPTDLGGYGITDAAASSVTLTAGAGMTGGGNLTASRTFNVIANADGSIVVNADDIQVGVITDAQHGNRSGGALHLGATTSVAGFVTMTTDLAGTGAAPIVVAITGAATIATVRCNNLFWDTALLTPSISQANVATAAAHGAPLLFQAQHSVGTGATVGGPARISSGSGATRGPIDLMLGGTTTLSLLATNELQWAQAVNEALYTQAAAASGNSGVNTTHRAQDGVGTDKNGGHWQAFGGKRSGVGLEGGIRLGLGDSVILFEAREIASGKYVTVLNHLAAATTGSTGADPGCLVTIIGDCVSSPVSTPSGAVNLCSVGSALYVLDEDDFETGITVA